MNENVSFCAVRAYGSPEMEAPAAASDAEADGVMRLLCVEEVL